MPAGVIQWLYAGRLPRTTSWKIASSCWVTGPILPLPTTYLSTEPTARISAAVPTIKISSATYSSVRSTERSTTVRPSSRLASSITEERVILSRIESVLLGVTSTPSRMSITQLPGPSATLPSVLRISAVS